MKSLGFYLIIALLGISVLGILAPYMFLKTGVVVTSVNNSNCGAIAEGDLISQISGGTIKNAADFYGLMASVKSGSYYPMVINGGPGGCTAATDGSLGIEVTNVDTRGIKFERSIGGGVEVVIAPSSPLPEAEVEKSLGIIQKRLSFLGIDGNAKIENGKIVLTTSSSGSAGQLIERGVVECSIRQSLEIRSGKSEIKIGSSRYALGMQDGKVAVNGTQIDVGNSFYLGSTKLTLYNTTNSSITIDASIFTNENILRHLQGSGGVSSESSGLYRFTVSVEIDKVSGERFGTVTDGLGTLLLSSQTSLNGLVVFSLDGKEISQLGIPVSFAGNNITTMSIVGFGKNVNDAVNKKTAVELAVVGSMPTSFKIEKITQTEPVNMWMLWSVPVTVLIVCAMLFIANRKHEGLKAFKASAAVILLETIYVFGVFVLVQSISQWFIDAYALLGLCVFLAVSAYEMTAISKGRESMKTARYVLMFASAIGFVTLFTPLRGLGISLIAGLIVHIAVTRPFFKSLV